MRSPETESTSPRNGLRRPEAQTSGPQGAGPEYGFPSGVIALVGGSEPLAGGSADTSILSTFPSGLPWLCAEHA